MTVLEDKMIFFTSMLPILLTGMTLLMASIFISREKTQSLGSAVTESLAWGFGFLITFSVEIMLFARL